MLRLLVPFDGERPLSFPQKTTEVHLGVLVINGGWSDILGLGIGTPHLFGRKKKCARDDWTVEQCKEQMEQSGPKENQWTNGPMALKNCHGLQIEESS